MSRVERIEEGDKLPCPLKTSDFREHSALLLEEIEYC